MSDKQKNLLVTGAAGQLGRLVVDRLLDKLPADRIAATLRDEAEAERLRSLGVAAFIADYDRPDTLDRALAGIGRVLLISSNALGQRVAQHRNVIEAARRAGIELIAYTSVLHADSSPLGLAAEHRETESLIQVSGLRHAILRNGWYTENYTASIPAALAHGTVLGSAGEGRIASAARADYADAAVAVLTAAEIPTSRIYELAGDASYTLAEFAAEIGRQAGRSIGYANLPEAEFKAALLRAGVPEPLAGLLADSDAAASKGALFDGSRQLSALIGHPTTPMAASVTAVLAQR
jgi:NAD(P)H dehydrogenase (quinone)